MQSPAAATLRIGAWRVDPFAGQISRAGEVVRVEARMMRLLQCLASRQGEVVSIDDLLSEAWSGVIVTPDSVYQAVATLRRLLGDDPKQPTYIATVPRLGYRLVAPVEPWIEEPAAVITPASTTITAGRSRSSYKVAVVLAVCVVIVAGLAFALLQRTPSASGSPSAQKTIAVLPFLDLTDEMSHEIFADGMTEELIDKLSRIPDLRVAPPTSSYYFKGKQTTIAEIAKSLGVAYVLDGSVRTSGSRLRVAARLVRADTGFVVWSETYDRPLDDLLMVQEDIAGEVAKALRESIDQAASARARH
jgi:transcriptional activator of cad operon